MSSNQGLNPKIRNLPDVLSGMLKMVIPAVVTRPQKMRKVKTGFNSEGMAKYMMLVLIFLSINAMAQNQIVVKGIVRDSTSGLPGAVIKVAGAANQGVATDNFGRFEIRATKSATLSITCVGFKSKQISLASQSVGAGNVITLDIRLENATTELQEVAVTGFGNTQKKASLVSSITTVNVKDLKTPSSNLTNALAGRIAGIIAFQSSGEPGRGTDNSTFYIRGLSTFGAGKRDPLILIDGVESTPTDMARLQPDDISDFSVLKDAAASSVYGARGANGVVLINTKMGMNGKPQFNFRVENRISKNTRDYEFADNITYMRMANEASITRTPNGIEPYSQNKINSTAAGEDPYLYPNNNWLDQLIKKQTINQGYNLNIAGGSNRARYYVAGTLNRDNGNLKVNPINNFNNNIRLTNYSIRSNIDFDLTKSTVLIIRMYGQFDDYQGPIGGGEQTFRNALNANPVMFPAVYPSNKLPFIEHPLFGSAQTRNTDLSLSSTLYTNPYAELVKGYQVYKSSNLQPQLELKQDLSDLTKGLSARAMGYLRRTSYYRINRNYNPFFYSAVINPQDQSYNLTALNDGGQNSIGTVGTEVLNFTRDAKDIDSRLWLEGSVNYNRTFKDKHAVGGMLVSYLSDYENANVDELIQSLPSRNAGISGRFSYGYDDRYLAEFNFGYNGSERFDTRNRWGFFPSIGVGYRISNEKFFEPLRGVISNLKFRATYGVAGNDAIGNVGDRFFYMSRVSLNDNSYGSSFGRNDGAPIYTRPGVSISRYANADISWERSTQLNIGMDLTVGKGVDVVVDVFKQKRTNILQPVANIDNAAGLMATTFSNFGDGTSKGVDMSGSYRANISRDFSINARGTFTYATTKIGKIDELPYPASLSYLSRKGTAFNQAYGYIAERLFIDDEEVANSPVQFGDRGLRAGDIKYRDINGDGVINTDDQVPIGYPTEPEITYGFGSSFRYKKFDFSFYFQGSARFSFFINSTQIQPFYQNGGYQTGLLKAISENYWTETNPNLYAFWPRLSTWRVPNNNMTSTWWMRNGNFLRLKNVEFGYSSDIKKLNLRNVRLYLSATNLFILSKFKMWDAEMRGNGMNYPLQSLYNLGLQVSL
ncbi:SusC/RagA family TonB-linked outer membrane protein [Pedobacter zeae]|uniref:TonB-linked SusC/RagA family outer membrane protein n=2 Tax=Pedobacter zeae TaxID=1737356 RepID=A0A7W6K768_9SPHI|nr:TonB-dependent receptor [Pedobacter zeae]MBB4106455.1 TonB-linked SusC/RagA family outer membrane protein [Pedobacter zeae]